LMQTGPVVPDAPMTSSMSDLVLGTSENLELELKQTESSHTVELVD
jgi:hypothetical protein